MPDVEAFTPASAALGGALIALSLAIMLVASGRVAGLSGVVAGLFAAPRGDRSWRLWFVVGMVIVGIDVMAMRPATFDVAARVPVGVVAVAGVLVGVGTRLANGCTSGHGLCGLGRGSKRSLIATLTFMAIAVATATVVGRFV